MTRSLAALSRLGVILVIPLILLACDAVSSPVPLAPTFISSPTTTPTASAALNGSPTSCIGFYMWADGSLPPEFITQVQDAMRTAGFEGSVQASTFGENDGCGEYHAKDVDYVFTVRVQSLDASEELASKASAILDIATRSVAASPAPGLGRVQLIFQAEDSRGCQWFYEDDAWNSGVPGAVNFSVCPAPVSAESERLSDVLADISADLACETSTLTANALQAVLECERPEGDHRYILTVTFRLNGQGYEGSCFHGYKANEFSMTGDEPMTVIEGETSYFERDRTIQWTANGVLYGLVERIKGGPDVTLPLDTREKVYLRAVQAGLIPGEGNDCR